MLSVNLVDGRERDAREHRAAEMISRADRKKVTKKMTSFSKNSCVPEVFDHPRVGKPVYAGNQTLSVLRDASI